MDELKGRHVLIFVEEDYEDLELWYPKLRLLEAGAGVTVAGPIMNHVYRGKHGYPCTADATIDMMEEADFDGLVIPGGWAPDKLRRDAKVLALTRAFHAARKLVAHICHGGWIAASADIVRGFRMTSTPGIKDDLVHAGAEWVDEPFVVDRHQVTSRRPDDLPHFCQGVIMVLRGLD